MKLNFSIKNLWYENSIVRPFSLDIIGQDFHSLVADFMIIINNQVLYDETDFCVVEFALALRLWLDQKDDQISDFIYETIESDLKEFVYFKQVNHNWLIGAANQNYEENTTFPYMTLTKAVENYLSDLNEMLLLQFNCSLDDIIEAARKDNLFP